MSELPPRLRLYSKGGYLLSRDGLSMTFAMRHPHARIVRAVMGALEAYLRAVGPDALSLYDDGQGGWQRLDEAGWAFVRNELLAPRMAHVCLTDPSRSEHRYRFHYQGSSLEPLPWEGEGSSLVSVVSCWLPTEYLETHGPDRVRELALELAALLPFCSGHTGFSFNGESDLLRAEPEVRELCFRHPGMDLPDPLLPSRLGTRVKGVHWLNFLGPPVLAELGGEAGLRERLSSPGTTVRELERERAVVSLGPWPEAGDAHEGRLLPAYRELARVLEPWLYLRDSPGAPEEVRRWECRFLDP